MNVLQARWGSCCVAAWSAGCRHRAGAHSAQAPCRALQPPQASAAAASTPWLGLQATLVGAASLHASAVPCCPPVAGGDLPSEPRALAHRAGHVAVWVRALPVGHEAGQGHVWVTQAHRAAAGQVKKTARGCHHVQLAHHKPVTLGEPPRCMALGEPPRPQPKHKVHHPPPPGQSRPSFPRTITALLPPDNQSAMLGAWVPAAACLPAARRGAAAPLARAACPAAAGAHPTWKGM